MKFTYGFLCTILLVSILPLPTQVQAFPIVYDAQHKPLTIMFDEAHNQYYNSTSGLFNLAISALENLPNVSLVFNNESFSDSLLAGVDVLIITNPNVSSSFQESNGVFEITAIEKFLTRGNGLFLLSNPYDENINKSGAPHVFNNLLDDDGLGVNPRTSFWEDNGDPDLVISDFDEVEQRNLTLFEIDTDHYIINNQTLLFLDENQENENFTVNRVSPKSQAILPQIQTPLISAGRENYAIKKNGISHYEEEDPIIMGYSLYRELGRVCLSGSTLMFSDEEVTYTIENTNHTTEWFNAFNNEELWIRTVLWLAGLFPLDEYVKPDKNIDEVTLYGVIFGIAGLGLISGAFLILIGRKEPIKPIQEELIERPAQKPEAQVKTKVKKPPRHKRKKR